MAGQTKLFCVRAERPQAHRKRCLSRGGIAGPYCSDERSHQSRIVVSGDPPIEIRPIGPRLELCRFLGRLHHKTIHALPRQASEKRQGTKSREESRRPLHALSSGEALLGTGINRQCCANSPVGDAYQRLRPNNAYLRAMASYIHLVPNASVLDR